MKRRDVGEPRRILVAGYDPVSSALTYHIGVILNAVIVKNP